MQQIIREAGRGGLPNEFFSDLARIHFVPTRLPRPAARGLDGDSMADTVGGELCRREEGSRGGVVLVRFEEAAALRDSNLVFTAFPVHLTGLVHLQVRGRENGGGGGGGVQGMEYVLDDVSFVRWSSTFWR